MNEANTLVMASKEGQVLEVRICNSCLSNAIDDGWTFKNPRPTSFSACEFHSEYARPVDKPSMLDIIYNMSHDLFSEAEDDSLFACHRRTCGAC